MSAVSTAACPRSALAPRRVIGRTCTAREILLHRVTGPNERFGTVPTRPAAPDFSGSGAIVTGAVNGRCNLVATWRPTRPAGATRGDDAVREPRHRRSAQHDRSGRRSSRRAETLVSCRGAPPSLGCRSSHNVSRPRPPSLAADDGVSPNLRPRVAQTAVPLLASAPQTNPRRHMVSGVLTRRTSRRTWKRRRAGRRAGVPAPARDAGTPVTPEATVTRRTSPSCSGSSCARPSRACLDHPVHRRTSRR